MQMFILFCRPILFALQCQNVSRDDINCDRDVDYVMSNAVDTDGCPAVVAPDAVNHILM